MHSPLDWIARVIMLVLAGMVSLSIIGAIAAIPSGTIENRIGIDQPAVDPGVAPPAPPEAILPPPEDRASTPGAPTDYVDYGPPPPRASDIELWLEAITYALLALVGLAALATLILWRTLKQRGRIADALEQLAARAGP